MLIDPANDRWVWAAAGVFLVLMAVRAWVVETGRNRLGRAPATLRVITGATALSLAVLIGLLVVQGGATLAEALISGTDPAVANAGAVDDAGTAPDPAGTGAVTGTDPGTDPGTGAVAPDPGTTG